MSPLLILSKRGLKVEPGDAAKNSCLFVCILNDRFDNIFDRRVTDGSDGRGAGDGQEGELRDCQGKERQEESWLGKGEASSIW